MGILWYWRAYQHWNPTMSHSFLKTLLWQCCWVLVPEWWCLQAPVAIFWDLWLKGLKPKKTKIDPQRILMALSSSVAFQILLLQKKIYLRWQIQFSQFKWFIQRVNSNSLYKHLICQTQTLWWSFAPHILKGQLKIWAILNGCAYHRWQTWG